MNIFSRRETYIYDRREWSIGNIIFFTCFCLFLASLLSMRFYFLMPLLLLADYGSLRISVTASKIVFRQGFLFSRRTILYDEIVDIVFRNSAQFVRHSRPSSLKQRDFGATFRRKKDTRFIINLHNNYFCVIGTEYAQEIVAAIRKAQPHIKID